jgi:hypothetical protein
MDDFGNVLEYKNAIDDKPVAQPTQSSIVNQLGGNQMCLECDKMDLRTKMQTIQAHNQ